MIHRMNVVFLLAVCLVCVGTIGAFGQKREINEDELKRLVNASIEKRRGKALRQTINTTGYGDGDWSKIIYEFGPDDSLHAISKWRVNGVGFESEIIRIGTTRYVRQKDGTWVEEAPRPESKGSGKGNGNGTGDVIAPTEARRECVYLGNETIDGRSAAHYRLTNKVTFRVSGSETTRTTVRDYWFGEDGLLVRESTEERSGKRKYTSVTEYVYDDSIKVVSPLPKN